MNPICVQEQHLPGDTVLDKWKHARAWGFDGIELRGRGDGAFKARLPELTAAAEAGVPMPTVCVEMPHFIGAIDERLRADAVDQLCQQLDVVAAIGGRGVMTPAAYGMHSNRLPVFPQRDAAEDRVVVIESLRTLGEHAAGLGVEVYLEPLNRYEDHLVNTVATAAEVVDAVGLTSVRIVPDTYHMNIEEADPAAALLAAGIDRIGHLQASDSNRLEPGAGHVDWSLFGATVRALGYDGPIAVESRLSGPADEVLPRVPPLLRRYL